ncbi:MAG TPA: methyltransferase domain-containing protein [Solirubrobacteraceae bacterium]|jgi:SAM-dependent methyltransferase
MEICTIIAKNYVAQARVLARSFAQHHEGGRCTVLVIDDYQDYLDPQVEPFTILTPKDVGCEDFEEMAWRYDVLELSTAVKPWLLSHLLAGGAPAVTYLDPDIRVHSSLQRLDDLAREHGVVLTPHNTVPLPDDGKRPNQIDILLAGVYNLGYVSLGASEEIARLLGWWRERLLTDCRVDPLNGYFVDQRWFDLAPGLVSDHAIVRDPQYNVAYWNLHCRSLERTAGGYTVDGAPLAFFHFSGFDPGAPENLSRHQSRVTSSPGSALRQICEAYAEEVIAAGYRDTKDWPYTYHELPSGVGLTRRLRKLYEIARERREVLDSPFTEEGADSFLGWLAEPAPDAPPGVNRLLAEMYGTRADLQAAFPDVSGEDLGAFLVWAAETGPQEEPALAAVAAVAASSEPAPAYREPPSLPGAATSPAPAAVRAEQPTPDGGRPGEPWGVNVVGYFRSELGTGEAARQVVSALDAGGVPLLPVHGRTIPPNRQGHQFAHLDHTDARYPVNLICMNADVLGEFAAQAGPGFFEARYSIGMWFWEVEQFPAAWTPAFDHLDELWLPTEHVAGAVGPLSPIPITKITLPVEMPLIMPATRAELELPEGFMFLFSFDYHSVFERKNPLAVLEAYTDAFEATDGAVLVIKSINADSAPAEHARLLAAADSRPDVHIVDGYLTAERKNLTLNACDCYVSLHRAEGFGLTMAEAMYLGKPVIATAYSGNLDFMTEANSFLVDHTLVPIGPGAPPYPAQARWAEPDVAHAAALMRDVFESREGAALRGARAAQDIRRTHSPAAAARTMSIRLDVLRERHASGLMPVADSAAQSELVRRRVDSGPARDAPSRLGAPGLVARRLALRAMKPFTAHQRSLDADIVELLAGLEAKVRKLDLDFAARHSTLLADRRQDPARREIWERLRGLTRSTIALEAATAELQRAASVVPELAARVDDLARSLQHIEWEGHAIPHMEGSPWDQIAHPDAGLVEGYRAGPGAGEQALYRSFEDTFRGSEKFIRERQRSYLRFVVNHAPVLDLGCGRGEFLDVLAENGIPYIGVDSDAGMVERCVAKGHEQVVNDDGVAYLERLEDASLGAIFCAQVIEHLPYERLLRLLELARAKLRPEGVLIAETVNPHSPAALKTFWVDPTHQHPIFPEVALVLARGAGFATAFVFHPNGSGDVARDRFTAGEFALVAGGEALLGAPDADRALADATVAGSES